MRLIVTSSVRLFYSVDSFDDDVKGNERNTKRKFLNEINTSNKDVITIQSVRGESTKVSSNESR